MKNSKITLMLSLVTLVGFASSAYAMLRYDLHPVMAGKPDVKSQIMAAGMISLKSAAGLANMFLLGSAAWDISQKKYKYGIPLFFSSSIASSYLLNDAAILLKAAKSDYKKI